MKYFMRRAFLSSAVLCAALGGFAAPSYAGLQVLTYDVYAGGIHGLEATLTIDTTKPEEYALSLYAKTRGFLGSLVPWEGTFESNGWEIAPGQFRPKLHRSETTWRDETEIKEYAYAKDGRFMGLSKKDHDKPRVEEKIPDELARNTTDVLTATMNVFHRIANGHDCAFADEVFDGKRRFEMRFNYLKDSVPPPSDYNVMRNSAQQCTVEVKPIAGKWHEKPRGWMSIQEQGRAKGTMPTIWFTQLADGEPAVPGKIMVKTDYGTLMLHLSEYRKGDTHLIAEKRK